MLPGTYRFYIGKDSRVFLQDILDSIRKIDLYLEDHTFESFREDWKTIDAVVRNVEIIGEAANNLTPEFREENQLVPWRKMIDTRNRIIHGYASVDIDIIWAIARNDLDQLEIEIARLVTKTGLEPDDL